jgi:hypothetical protein
MKNATINKGVIKKIAFALGELNKQVIYVGGATVRSPIKTRPSMLMSSFQINEKECRKFSPAFKPRWL